MKLNNVIKTYKSMFYVKKKCINSINILHTGSHTYEGKHLKRILTYLYCTKCNEISICHSDFQKHVSYTRLRERFLLLYGLCFKTS